MLTWVSLKHQILEGLNLDDYNNQSQTNKQPEDEISWFKSKRSEFEQSDSSGNEAKCFNVNLSELQFETPYSSQTFSRKSAFQEEEKKLITTSTYNTCRKNNRNIYDISVESQDCKSLVCMPSPKLYFIFYNLHHLILIKPNIQVYFVFQIIQKSNV